jgi:hypothetical protein
LGWRGISQIPVVTNGIERVRCFLSFDVGLAKSCAVAVAAYSLLFFRIGTRVVQSLSAILLIVALVHWTDIAGINELATAAHQGLQQNYAQR